MPEDTEVGSPSGMTLTTTKSIVPLTIEKPPHVVRNGVDKPALRHFQVHRELPQAIGIKASPNLPIRHDPLSAAEQGRKDIGVT